MKRKKSNFYKKVEKWSKDNSICYLAWKLGYEKSQTINHWFKRKSVPRHLVETIELIMSQPGGEKQERIKRK